MIKFKNRSLVFLFIVPVLVGFIILPRNESSNFESRFKKCSEEGTSRLRMSCFEKVFAKDFETKGQKWLLNELEEVQVKDDNSKQSGITKCHDAAHSIGMIAGMTTTNVQESFSNCTNTCGFGCHMGVIEGYFHTHTDSLKEFPEICKKSSHVYSCVHAVGHYIAHLTGNLERSLSTCDLIQEVEYRGHCTSGVFMEIFEQPIHSDTSIGFPQDITKLCNSLHDIHKSFCFTMSGFYEYLRTSDLEKGISMCKSSPEKEICFMNFSKALYYRENGSEDAMYDFCKSIPSSYLSDCQSGVVDAAALSDPLARHGFLFCNLYEGVSRDYCFNTLGNFIEGTHESEEVRKKLCDNIPQEDKNSCLRRE